MKVRVTVERLDDSGNVVESRAVLRSCEDGGDDWVTDHASMALANVVLSSDQVNPTEFVSRFVLNLREHYMCFLPDAFIAMSSAYLDWIMDDDNDADFDKWFAKHPNGKPPTDDDN